MNVDTSRFRNLMWDSLIAFNIGETIGRWPLFLVTDDSAFADVARASGLEDRIYTLPYEQWLA